MGQLAAEYGDGPSVSGTQYYTADHLGSTRLITDQSGNVAERLDYFPFGEGFAPGMNGRSNEYPLYNAGARPANPKDGESIKFTGKERDAETALDYFGARYMSSVQGRFTSADPYEINVEVSKAKSEDQRKSVLNGYIGNPQAWNRYAYTLNNPLRLVDLNGKCSKPANLKEGETGICIEAFIASKTIGGIGKGDNRTFTGTDPSKTQRVRVDITIAPGKTGAINTEVKTAQSETIIPGLSAQGHTEMIPVGVTTDAQGNRNFEVNFVAINGFAGWPGAPAGSIKADLNFSVTPNGQVSLNYDNSSITGFPSFGVYTYGTGANGQPQVKSLVEAKEKDPSYLTKPAGPVPRQ